MVFELKHDILWMHFLACFIKRHGQYEAAVPLKWFLFWQVNNQSEPLTNWMSAAESNTFLFPDFDVIALPPQLVWSYNSTKHGSPSVCIACLCLTGEELCECKPERRGDTLWFFWNKVKKNPHLWDSEAPHCASNIQGGFTFCVGKIAAD